MSKKEFRQALQVLGLEASRRKETDALFDTYDPDRSGEIDYGELSKAFTRFSSPVTLTLTLTLTLTRTLTRTRTLTLTLTLTLILTLFPNPNPNPNPTLPLSRPRRRAAARARCSLPSG